MKSFAVSAILFTLLSLSSAFAIEDYGNIEGAWDGSAYLTDTSKDQVQACRLRVEFEFIEHPQVKYRFALSCSDSFIEFGETVRVDADWTFGAYARKGNWLFSGFVIDDNTQSTGATELWRLSILSETDVFESGKQRMVFNFEERTNGRLIVANGLLFRAN